MAFSLEDFSPEQQEAISQVLADEQDFFPGLLPSPNTVGRGLAGLNDITNKIPGLNNFTDQFDYEPGGFSRFQERAQEQPLRNTAREVFDFAQGRATDIPIGSGLLSAGGKALGMGAATVTGMGGLGVKTTQALGSLAKSHPMIATLLGSIGLDYAIGDEEQAVAPEMQQQAPGGPAANDGGRLQEVLNQRSTGRRDEIMAAIQSTGPNRQMISVGPDDDLGAMGIGKNYSKVAYTPARREVDAQKEMLIASKLQDEVIPKFEENARKIADNLRKVFAKDNSSLPRKKSATGKEDPIAGADFEEYIANEGRRLALLEVPGSFRKYIPTSRPGNASAQAAPAEAPAPEQPAEDDGFGMKELAIGGGALAVAIAAARKGKLKPLQDLLTKGGKKGFEMGKVTAEAVKPDAAKLRAGNKAARRATKFKDEIANSTKQLSGPEARLGLPAPDVNFQLGQGGQTLSRETVEILRAAAQQGKLKETLAQLGLTGTKQLTGAAPRLGLPASSSRLGLPEPSVNFLLK